MRPITLMDDIPEMPHVRFKYFEYSLRIIGASSVDLWWQRPPFLMGDPETHLDVHKNEIYEWLFQTYGEGNYLVKETLSHEWTVFFLEDANNAKLILFKLRWGDSYEWNNT